MTLARLLPAVLLLCSLSGFAQDQPLNKLPASAAIATPSEPWRIIPDQDQFRVDPGTRNFKLKERFVTMTPGRDGQLDADTTCYTMRSYVVARDAKDSDSTHPVSYSTCQPATRYRVKTTDIRSESVDR